MLNHKPTFNQTTKTYLECRTQKSAKWYEIELVDTTLYIRYGSLITKSIQLRQLVFDTQLEANYEYQKILHSKLLKGYIKC